MLITLEEIQRAEGEILKHVQQQSFPEETANPKKQVKKSSHLYKLDPIFVDGLLRVGGRLCNSTLSPESKNQIILPRDDHVSRLIIYHYLKTCGHSGKEHVLSRIRERFWITQGSSAVKSVLAKCVICRRLQASLCQQKMADLPEDRVQPESSHRNSWPLGRIVEVFLDKSGLVRRAKVSMKSGVFERPIDKLCPLVEGEK